VLGWNACVSEKILVRTDICGSVTFSTHPPALPHPDPDS
jgi:hypothetical protein